MVVYVFVMHFDYAIQVTDLSMKIFCVVTCVISSLTSMTLDYFLPYYNTVVYNLFGLRPDMDRYEMSKLHLKWLIHCFTFCEKYIHTFLN